MSDRAGSSSPKLYSATVGALASRVILLGLALVQGALLARGLGPAGLGRYSAMLVDVNLLVALMSCGLPGALAVLLAEESKSGSRLGLRLKMLRRIALRHGAAMLAILGLGGLSLVAGVRLPERTPLVCALLGVAVLVQYGRDVVNSLLWGGQRFSVQNRVNVLVQLALLFGIASLVLSHGLGPESAVALQLAGNLLWITGAWRAARPAQADPDASPQPEDGLLRRARAIGMRNYFSQLLDLLLLRIDVYLIQNLLPAASMERDLGLYQAGVRVAELALMLPGTLNALLFAKAAAAEEVALTALCSAKFSLWLGLFALVGMALLGQPLLVLFFGARFAGSFWPCLGVLGGCVAMCFSGPLAGTLQGAAGYPRSVFIAQALSLVVNVAANLYLLPRYGIFGAALASCLAYGASAALIAAAFGRRFAISAGEILRPETPWALWRHLRQA